MINVAPVFSTDDREALIAAVVGSAGIMRIGMFDPALITSGRLRKLLPDWTCPGGQGVYALYRKSARLAPKVPAFLAFAEEAFAAFDPEELTVIHRAQMTSVHRRRNGEARLVPPG